MPEPMSVEEQIRQALAGAIKNQHWINQLSVQVQDQAAEIKELRERVEILEGRDRSPK